MAKKGVKEKPKDKTPGIFHSITDFFISRLRIKERVEEAKKEVLKALFSLKKEFIKTLVEAMFLLTGLLALVIGLIILISKHYPIEYVLIGYGVVVTILVLMRMKLDV